MIGLAKAATCYYWLADSAGDAGSSESGSVAVVDSIVGARHEACTRR